MTKCREPFACGLMAIFTFVLALGLSAGPAVAECRIGFDVGSSGVRVGWATNASQARTSIDYLADVWTDNRIDTTVDATIDAFTTLPREAGMPSDCAAVAGGYSAWRLAVERGSAAEVAATLKKIHAQSNVALFVIPQDVEGTYGYFAAQRSLGDKLRTPFILDIGGGSMQIASIEGGWGAALGQKAWRKLYCRDAKGDDNAACAVNPVGTDAIRTTRKLLARDVATAKAALGSLDRVTAVSAPLVKAVHPVIRYLAEHKRVIGGKEDSNGFDMTALSDSIQVLADKDDAALVRYLDGCPDFGGNAICAPRFVATLVTDMLIVHAFMEGLGIRRLDLAEADLTNVPGLLADTRALAWSRNYGCYLTRLARQGTRAFKSDPATCPK